MKEQILVWMDMQMYITIAHEIVNENADAYVNAYASAYEICI